MIPIVRVWGAVASAAAAVLVAALLLGWIHDGAAASSASTCRSIAAASSARREAASGSGETVVVIGDSYAQGAHLVDPAASWPAWLPGRVVVDGFSGSGYTAEASPCPGARFADRVPDALTDDPSLVVVEGGLNDYDASSRAIRAGARSVIAALSGHRAVLVGPPSPPSRAVEMVRVDAVLRAVAARRGVAYVSTLTWRLPYLSDGLHLTAEGHRVFGQEVAAGIAAVA